MGQSQEIVSVTWSSEFNVGDIHEWEITTFIQNSQTVVDPVNNVSQGSILKIEILQNLSQIVIPAEDYPDNLPDVNQLAEITIDGVKSEFFLLDSVFFIVPINVKLTSGSTNAFFGAIVEPDFGLINTNGTLNQDIYIESFRNGTYFEEFIWELNTGLLNSLHYLTVDLDIRLERIFENPDDNDDDEGILFFNLKFVGFVISALAIRRWQINKGFRQRVF